MTLAEISSIIDHAADVAIATGATPADVQVEIFSQDGQVHRIEYEWKSGKETFTMQWKDRP